MFESAAETRLRWFVWSPSRSAATVRKFSDAVFPPPALTIESGTDQDLVTLVPPLSEIDLNPLLSLLRSHFFHTCRGC
ncbi:MAG: Uncharacterised protein [Methanobacteriota archaeon]|nr:MAG: Uncharacterised protein [Euryarchaeota archaeon]